VDKSLLVKLKLIWMSLLFEVGVKSIFQKGLVLLQAEVPSGFLYRQGS